MLYLYKATSFSTAPVLHEIIPPSCRSFWWSCYNSVFSEGHHTKIIFFQSQILGGSSLIAFLTDFQSCCPLCAALLSNLLQMNCFFVKLFFRFFSIMEEYYPFFWCMYYKLSQWKTHFPLCNNSAIFFRITSVCLMMVTVVQKYEICPIIMVSHQSWVGQYFLTNQALVGQCASIKSWLNINQSFEFSIISHTQ